MKNNDFKIIINGLIFMIVIYILYIVIPTALNQNAIKLVEVTDDYFINSVWYVIGAGIIVSILTSIVRYITYKRCGRMNE